jgi:acyl-CoA reductase-like NAD-dependent aldehyde dehydrogenase
MPKTFRNFIAGRWVAPSNRSYFENRNPANTRELIGRFPDSGADDVSAAVQSAVEGFRKWSATRSSSPAK